MENKIITLTAESFAELSSTADKTLMIDFYADWCGPCKMLAPIIDEVAEENDDVIFCKVNVDDAPSLAVSFGIQSIPALAFIKDEKLAEMSVGLITKEKLLALIERNK